MSSVTEQRSRPVCVAHVCSVCGSPVVLNSVIVGRLWSSALLPPSLDGFLDEVENNIGNYAKKRQALGKYGGRYSEEELKNRMEWASGNSNVGIMVPHLEEGCPCCGFQEAWQYPQASEEQLTGMSADSCPVLIKGRSRAELWAQERLLSSIQSIHADHLNPARVAYADKCRRMLLEQLRAEQTEMSERPIKQRLDSIEKSMALLEEQLKQLGTFSFKEKKPINQQLDKLRKEQLSTRSQLYRREKELKFSIPNLKNQANRISLIISDVMDLAEMYVTPYSYAYRLIPKSRNTQEENITTETTDARLQTGAIPEKEEAVSSNLLLSPGTIIANRYRIESVLGMGEFGVSYCARNSQNARTVLIEYAPMGVAGRMSNTITMCPLSHEKQSVYEDGKAEFLDDVKSMTALGEDGYYAKILEFFQLNGTAYCISEYLENVDPGQYIPNAFLGM